MQNLLNNNVSLSSHLGIRYGVCVSVWDLEKGILGDFIDLDFFVENHLNIYFGKIWTGCSRAEHSFLKNLISCLFYFIKLTPIPLLNIGYLR